MTIDHYERLRGDADTTHPVEAAVARRVKHQRATRRLLRLQAKVIRALGDKRSLFIRLSDLVGAIHYERESAHFDEGYRHGFAEGLSRGARWRLSRPGKAIARELRLRLIGAGVPPLEALRAVAEAMWLIANEA